MKLLCKIKGEHDWLLDHGSDHGARREFITVTDVCLRCGHQRTLLPYGRCLGDHPIADHYDQDGHLKSFAPCPAGGPA